MSEQTDDGQMNGTDIPDVDQVENVICVNQNHHQTVIQDGLMKGTEIGITIKHEGADESDQVLGISSEDLHANNAGIITIPVVGMHEYSVIGEETVVTPISVSLSSPGHNNNQQPVLTWEDAVSADILPVRCKDTNAELHKSKFGSGNKGKCIKSGDQWYTPTEFEAICGRGNSKDWKRSIRFGGRTLQTLIDKKFLVPHASSCICSNCVDDATATGPIRPFTPYQRKRKNRNNEMGKSAKVERLTSKDSTTDESSDVGTSPVGLSAGIGPLTQALIKITHTSLPSNNDEAWKTMEDAVEKLVSAGILLKSMLQEMKERTTQEIDSLKSQLHESSQNLQEALNQQRQQQSQTVTISRNLEPQILRIFDSNRIQTYSIEVLDPETFRQLGVTTNPPSPTGSPKENSANSNAVLPPISQLF